MSWSLAGQTGTTGPGWGDLAALILIIACMTPDAVFQKLFFLGDKSPHFIIRHGLLFPVQALLIYQLALNRGWVARLLSHPVFEKLGEASFGIFIFQGLMIFPIIMGFTALGPSLESWLQKFSSDEHTVAAAQEFIRLGVSVGVTVGLSLLSLRYFERPVARWLKQKFGLRSSAA